MPDIRPHADQLLQLITAALPMETGEGDEGKLAWDESNQCALTFDDTLGVIITLDEVVDAIFLNWVLGDLPQDPESAVDAMQELLEANHEWRGTEGGALGLDPDTGAVTLSYRVDLPLDDPSVIQDIIVKLYNTGHHWQQMLRAGYAADEAEAEPAHSVRDALA